MILPITERKESHGFCRVAARGLVTAVAVSLCLCGCAAVKKQYIREKADVINLKDGLDRQEAVILAQRELINGPHRREFNFCRPLVRRDDLSNLWIVSFAPMPANHNPCAYRVIINADTGELDSSCYQAQKEGLVF